MADRPTLTTLSLFGVVFVTQTVAGAVGVGSWAFTLALPLERHPWTLVVSVYAHGDLMHLAVNAVALAVVGPLVARVTTPPRFHAFFLTAGALAGVTHVVVTAAFAPTAVLGASGAIFALFGYLLVGNRASERVLSWVPLGRRGRLVVFLLLAVGVTLATAAPGVAVVAHFVGFLLGSLCGRLRVLHVGHSRLEIG
ncbi:rhomboid family intramembrane serine protease [Natronomonas gomsonensis]|uniref:rhomboid family intramembrane serine protease n=1 Tax=Natronomonas gomsonensis TaxID=1046043 RepID=UPI0020CA9900|nr:rhomboid family intramembrane serine protease [Natronomonas gomsonensis]MCY4729288.1 rhomboid family intramembrane serine protease [Natronomonas gomsonensis]